MSELRQPTGCAYTRYLALKWRVRAAKAKAAYDRWVQHFVIRDIRYAPGANSWLRSVNEVQKIFPGTRSWLLSCSSSEGGWGRWVPNSEGSGVGGWLQFMPGTFSGFFSHSKSYAERRRFVVPAAANSWYSPLGQAMAGGWAITHGMRHHWAGSGC